VIFEWDGTRIAPLVCYDLRFPELFRAALSAGAEMFVVIAAWPTTRIEHWLTLLRARAIENQATVVGVNGTGQEPQHRYCGRSIVIDPHGHILADAGEEEGALPVQFASGAAREWREQFPAVRDFLR
jgi:predicted amidohydrolase